MNIKKFMIKRLQQLNKKQVEYIDEKDKEIEHLKIELKNTEEIKCQCDKDAIYLQEEIEQLGKEVQRQSMIIRTKSDVRTYGGE